MALRVGESGKIIRVDGADDYDMSSNTELTLTFTKPDGTTLTKVSADGVVIGAGVTDPDLGTLAANTYVEYPIEDATIIDAAGTWSVKLTYTNTGAAPDDIFISSTATFTVVA